MILNFKDTEKNGEYLTNFCVRSHFPNLLYLCILPRCFRSFFIGNGGCIFKPNNRNEKQRALLPLSLIRLVSRIALGGFCAIPVLPGGGVQVTVLPALVCGWGAPWGLAGRLGHRVGRKVSARR